MSQDAKINTKTQLKAEVTTFINSTKEPFTTREAEQELQQRGGKVRISPNRLTNLMRATKLVDFDSKAKKWIKKTSLL